MRWDKFLINFRSTVQFYFFFYLLSSWYIALSIYSPVIISQKTLSEENSDDARGLSFKVLWKLAESASSRQGKMRNLAASVLS